MDNAVLKITYLVRNTLQRCSYKCSEINILILSFQNELIFFFITVSRQCQSTMRQHVLLRSYKQERSYNCQGNE